VTWKVMHAFRRYSMQNKLRLSVQVSSNCKRLNRRVFLDTVYWKMFNRLLDKH